MILLQDCSSHLDSSKNMATRGWGLFSLYIYIENFKNLLVRKHWTDFHIILQKCSRLFKPLQDCSSHLDSSKNMATRGWGLFSLYIYIENFKNLLVRKHWTNFHIILQKCSRLFKPLQDCSSHLDSSKNMAARGRGLFSLYIYIENFKNLVRNHSTNFSISLQKCSFGDPLPRLKIVQAIWIRQKTWLPGGGGGANFPYISI